MQITNAMKMVSAAKLSRAQDAIDSMRPYANKLSELLENLMASLDENEGGSQYAEQRDVKRVLLVPISSNRGLAGPFNANIIKKTKALVRENHQDHQIELFSIGKKANDVLQKSFGIHALRTEIFDNLHFEEVEKIAEELMDLYVKGSYDEIHLIYNHFKNAATQVVLTEQFLPIKPVEHDQNSGEQLDYIFEPEKKGIIKEMIPKSLKMQLFKALRDSFASEHGARMTAMHSATENATELRDDLKLKYNKARQASITNEILEIVGGAEALAD